MTFLLFQSQGRTEIMSTLEKVIKGLGSAGNSTYKDVYKATKQCMTDRSMVVRFAAAKVSYIRLKDNGIPYTGNSTKKTPMSYRLKDREFPKQGILANRNQWVIESEWETYLEIYYIVVQKNNLCKFVQTAIWVLDKF